MYVNPIPFIDEGKQFEMRVMMRFDDIIPAEEAKRKCAEYLKNAPVEEIIKFISCTDIKPIYPENS